MPIAKEKKPNANQMPMSKQSVLSLNMKQWRDMVEHYKVGEEDGVSEFHGAEPGGKSEGS